MKEKLAIYYFVKEKMIIDSQNLLRRSSFEGFVNIDLRSFDAHQINTINGDLKEKTIIIKKLMKFLAELQ